jgi:hypothetical protein
MNQETRAEQETIVKNYAKVAAIIDFPTPINTHIGRIDMLDMTGAPIRVDGKDWVVLGDLSDLYQHEMEAVRLAVLEHARQILFSAYRH